MTSSNPAPRLHHFTNAVALGLGAALGAAGMALALYRTQGQSSKPSTERTSQEAENKAGPGGSFLSTQTGSMEGKVVVVVGGGSQGAGIGIGKAISIVLARQGATVIVVDRELARAQETCELIDGKAFPVACDVSQPDAVQKLAESIATAHGRIDGLVNNVGLTHVGGLLDVTVEQWERLFAVNLTGMFQTCKHCVPHMLSSGGGAIVNISSLSSIRALRPEVVRRYREYSGLTVCFSDSLHDQ